MFKTEHSNDKMLKTTLLLATINLLASPLYYVAGGSAGSLISLAINAFSVYQFHELGRSRRPGANAVTSARRFFSAQTSSQIGGDTQELENTYRNIINGGAALADEIAQTAETCISKLRR